MNPYLSRARRILLTAALLLTGCSGLDSVFGPSGQGETSSNPTVPSSPTVDLIANGLSKASHTMYWLVYLGSTAGTSEWAFFANGTGAFRMVTPNINCANQGIEHFTWTRLRSDALLVGLAQDVRCGPPFTNFSSIEGSFGSGKFTTILDGNPSRRTFTLLPGVLP